MFAKAGLGILALASLGAATPSNAQAYIMKEQRTAAIPQGDACSRAPEFRPIWCYLHHPRGFAWGWRYKTEANAATATDRQQQRQAFLEHRYRNYRR
jgi:hypothetical protein